jgi:alpha-D-xyloside xylohydrolase
MGDFFKDERRKFEHVKRIISYERQKNSFLFNCETDRKNQMSVRLDLCAEDVFRLRMGTGEILDKKTPMVVVEKLKDIEPKLEEATDSVSLWTPQMIITIHKDPWQLTVHDSMGRLVCQENISDKDVGGRFKSYPLGFSLGEDPDDINVFETMQLFPDEHFYGFGEKFSDLDKRGQKMVSWTVDALSNSSQKSYKNVPFFMSSRGYGIFVNSSYPIIYQMGSHSFVSYSFLIEDRMMDYYFIYGPSFKRILQLFTELTGKAPVPPKWSFGIWMSRCGYKSRQEVEEVAQKLREHDIPCDVIHIDPFWMKWGHWTDLEWDEEAFPNPKEMISHLHEMGFKLSLWENPYIARGTKMFDEGAEMNCFVRKRDGSIYEIHREWEGVTCALVDFSNPEAVKWFQEKHRKLMEMGVDVFKTDFGEAAPIDGVYHDGTRGEEMHNLYPLLYNRAVFEVVREFYGRGIVWGRSGYAGSQRYPVCWSGDPASDFATMASVLRGGLSLSLSGVPFWSHDIGGFYSKPSAELYVRWAQFGLFCSHSRCHGVTPREPWAFGEEVTQIFRRYAKLRYRLLPYIYSCAHISSLTGLPMIRSMALEFQDDPNCHDKDLQYMFGEAFLVALFSMRRVP